VNAPNNKGIFLSLEGSPSVSNLIMPSGDGSACAAPHDATIRHLSFATNSASKSSDRHSLSSPANPFSRSAVGHVGHFLPALMLRSSHIFIAPDAKAPLVD
jgi:hypothetical protein